MLFGQNNNTCQTAIPLNIDTVCTPSLFQFSIGQSEKWYNFNTLNFGTLRAILSLQNYYTGNNSIFNVQLYTGTCNSLQLINNDTLLGGDSIFFYDYQNLINNSTCLLRIERQSSLVEENFTICLEPEALPFQVSLNNFVCQPQGLSSCYQQAVKQCPNFYTACVEEELIFYPDAFLQNSIDDYVEWRIVDFIGPGSTVLYGPVTTGYSNNQLDSFSFVPGMLGLTSGTSYWVVASYYNYLPNYGITCFWTEIQMEIYLEDAPSTSFVINPNPPYCMNEQIFLTNTTINHPGNQFDYWDMGDGGTAVGTGSATYTYINPGNYTITFTLSNLCGESTVTQNIEIGPLPKFEVPAPLCAGQDFTFNNTTSCLQYVQSWFWDFGDGTSSTQQSPSHTYANPGSYTVKLCLIDANGQQHCIQQQVTVHPSPAPPVILGNLYICDPNPEFCVQNPQPGYTYTWNITNGFPQSYNGNCVEVNWNQSGSGYITVIATNQYGCISVTDAEVAECCYKEDINNPGTEINLYNTTASFIINNLLGGSSTWTTNTYINLNGVMIIDQDFTFSNCPNIYLGQNARIEIPNGKKLRIDNASKLEAACPQKMWDGIYLKTYTSEFEADFSTFMHAQNAVVSQNGAKYTITSSTFNQNWIGIKVEPFAFNHPGIVTAAVFGPTSFLCTDTLKYPYHNQQRSHAGMYIQQVGNQNGSITIGNSILFDNQNTGILAEASNILVIGNVFQNMGIVQGQGGGIGVHAKGGDLGSINTIVGGLPANTNSFNNCFTGVLIEHWQDAEVSYNMFNGTNNTAITGIRVQHITKYGQPIPFKNITVKNNNINNYQTGVSLYSNMNAKVNVFKNNINQQGVQFGTGITAQEMPISTTFNLTSITQNNIVAPASGIVAGGVRNVLISENDVTKLKQHNLINTYGVLLRGCFNARVSANNVSSQTKSSNTRQHGYAFELSEGTFATCNEADSTGTGMRCAGAMPNSFILGNTFKNNYHGFTMSNNAIIGEQYRMVQNTKYPSDNRWQGNFNSRSVANAIVNPDKNLSPFYVRSISGNNTFYPNAGVIALNQLFLFHLVKNPPLLCDKILNPGIKKGISQQIAKKQIPLSDTTSVIGRIQVFESLQQNYTWQPDVILAQFTDSMQATSYRALQLIDSTMFDTAQCNITLLNNCQSIVPQNHVEQHIQNASEIYISSRVSNNGIYTPQQISDLEYIAWLCPFDDGQGVYLARFLLQEVSNTEYLNSCEDATGNNLRISGNEQEDETIYAFIKNKEKISVYPNSANETFSVELDQEREIQIEVFDMLGQKVVSQFSKSKLSTVAVVNLPTGLYIVKIRTGETEENHKINVQH